MSETETRLWKDNTPLDHNGLSEHLQRYSERYSFLGIGSLGCSILGKDIPLLTLGHGPAGILYVGAHHGMEWMTSLLLLRFVNELCEYARNNRTAYRMSVTQLLESHTLYVIPMLNPDGVDYQIHGVGGDNPLRDRVLRMNGGSEDFSHWQANARGVDLNHNYDAGFAEYKQIELDNGIPCGAPTRFSGEAPESEPEVAYLCNFIRFHEDLRGVLTLHTQGEEIFYQSGGRAPAKSASVARRLSQLCGYRLSTAMGAAAYGGLTDWCVQKMELPSFTLECGRGTNPLPLSACFPIYANLREALFSFPKLLC